MTNDVKIIRKEFRRSEEARYFHRLHGVLLVLLGLSTVKAGKLLGDPQRTIAHWVIQFRERGLAGLNEVERPGRPGILNALQRKTLAAALAKSPKHAGLEAGAWNGAVVSSFLHEHYSITLSRRQCYRLLAALKNQTKT
jgi:transposase